MVQLVNLYGGHCSIFRLAAGQVEQLLDLHPTCYLLSSCTRQPDAGTSSRIVLAMLG